MQLYFRDVCLGEITDVGKDFPWVIGTLLPNENAAHFREFFDYMVDEEKTDDPPFAEELLDDGNWSVMDDAGKRLDIMVPAVHPDGQIWWMWNSESPRG